MKTIPDLDGWEVYCEVCKAFREARRTQDHDVSDGTEYFEFVMQHMPLNSAAQKKPGEKNFAGIHKGTKLPNELRIASLPYLCQ